MFYLMTILKGLKYVVCNNKDDLLITSLMKHFLMMWNLLDNN